MEYFPLDFSGQKEWPPLVPRSFYGRESFVGKVAVFLLKLNREDLSLYQTSKCRKMPFMKAALKQIKGPTIPLFLRKPVWRIRPFDSWYQVILFLIIRFILWQIQWIEFCGLEVSVSVWEMGTVVYFHVSVKVSLILILTFSWHSEDKIHHAVVLEIHCESFQGGQLYYGVSCQGGQLYYGEWLIIILRIFWSKICFFFCALFDFREVFINLTGRMFQRFQLVEHL